MAHVNGLCAVTPDDSPRRYLHDTRAWSSARDDQAEEERLQRQREEAEAENARPSKALEQGYRGLFKR